ncbi:MAG: hypothetical protein H6569_07375 [Lewinellaceae bacterium]|nr:hypothetical protein [Lewinellaceae bacterium]
MTASKSTTCPSPPNAGISREREHHSLQGILILDLNLRREELKEALLDYEDTHPGNNLVGSKVYEFLRHCQNIVWKQLAELALENPAEYAAWKNGERGHWQLETNNVAHGVLLRLSEGRRARLHEPGAAIERTKSGLPVVSDNIRRTVLNWRKKTTAIWALQNGSTLNGFPFFLSWTRLNRAGEVDPKGRGNVIGLVNLTWIFGPEWTDKSGENASDSGADLAEQREKFSTIPPILKTAPDKLSGKKKEEKPLSANAEADFSQSAKPTISNMKTAQQQGTPQGDSGQIFEQKNVALAQPSAGAPPSQAGPTPGGGSLARAAALWQFLLMHLYVPLFGTGRIRHSSQNPFTGDCFRTYTAEKCVELLAENLHSARNAGDASLEEAEMRLRHAIEAQAKYLEDNPETWVLTPEKFLRPDRPHGNLLSALRLFVKETHAPPLPSESPENEPDRERKNRLYAHLLTLGAHRTHPGTFARWYSQYGPQHLEACLSYMAQQASRRRQAGRPEKREFDSNRGGASAYFASLITRFDSKGLQREAELAERQQLKNALWEQVFAIEKGQSTAELERLRSEMTAIYHRLCSDADFRDAAIRDTNAFFGMRIGDYTRPTIVVLIHHVLQQQNPETCS